MCGSVAKQPAAVRLPLQPLVPGPTPLTTSAGARAAQKAPWPIGTPRRARLSLRVNGALARVTFENPA